MRALAALVGVWLSLGAVLVALEAVRGLPDVGGEEPPHFAATVTGNPPWTRQRGELEALRGSTRGDVFIVRSDASYFYLAGDLENPTPYDFAVRSDFGVNGERGVVKAIARGHPRWVCIHRKRREGHKPDVRPLVIERAVQTQLRLVARSRVCDLYRAP